MLAALGISEFDERVYRTCLAKPDQTAPEIAEHLGAAPSRIRHALARLVELGVLRRERHGHYRPISPRTALSPLLAKHRADAEASFTAMGDAVDDLASEYRASQMQGDPTGLVEVITGEAAVTLRVSELIQSIRSHLWVLDRPPYLGPYSNDLEEAMTMDLLGRDVDIRSVYTPEALEQPGRFELITRLAQLGEQARFLPTLPFKLRIMDCRVALVALIGGRYDSVAVVHRSGLLDALLELFDAHWQRAQPIVGTAPGTPDQPSTDDLVLLRMLQAGYKDQAIARQLGTSAHRDPPDRRDRVPPRPGHPLPGWCRSRQARLDLTLAHTRGEPRAGVETFRTKESRMPIFAREISRPSADAGPPSLPVRVAVRNRDGSAAARRRSRQLS